MSTPKTSAESTNQTLDSMQHRCAGCGKLFFSTPSYMWTYKIVIQCKTHWYCGYNCWKGPKDEREQQIINSREAYYNRLRAKKKVENRRRKERAHGRCEHDQTT